MSMKLEKASDIARDLTTLAEAAHRFYEAIGYGSSEEHEHLLVTILMIEDRAASLKDLLYEATDPVVVLRAAREKEQASVANKKPKARK